MAISKKIRFEIFKRDGFKCQYCGKAPPSVILEIDHINPKSKKGKDSINNLITACFDCNRGKRDIPLGRIPTSLVVNLEVLKEKELQINEYNKFVKKIEIRIKKDMQEIDDIYNTYFNEWHLSDIFKNNTLKRFSNALPKQEIKDAMHNACNKMIVEDSHDKEDNAIRYFCGICWTKIRNDNKGTSNGER